MLKKKINWTGIKVINENLKYPDQQKYIYYLNFDAAQYKDLNTLLPYYYEIIPVNSSNFTAELSDLVFEPLSLDEKTKVKNLDKIKDIIIFDPKISYDSKKPYLLINFLPLKKTNNGIEKLVSFTLIIKATSISKSSVQLKNTYSVNSVLSSGDWYKIRISNTGIHKLTYSQLVAIGLSNPENVRVYGFGGMLPENNFSFNYDDLPENAIYMEKGSDNIFNDGDYILFYANGPVSWKYDIYQNVFRHQTHLYSNYSYYFLTSSYGSGKKIGNINSSIKPSNHNVNSFNDYSFHEIETENLIRSGREYYEPIALNETKTFSFSFPNIIPSEGINIQARVIGRSNEIGNFTIQSNGTTVLTLTTSKLADLAGYTYALDQINNTKYTPDQSNISLSVNFTNSLSNSYGWIDYIILNARRELKMYNNLVFFRDINSVGFDSVSNPNVAEYTVSGANSETIIWEVTDPINVKKVNATLIGSDLVFRLESDSLREFVAFTRNAVFNIPVYQGSSDVGKIANQNLHALAQTDYVIVTHPSFITQANQLAEIHRNDGLKVTVIEQEKIFNEFSSGTPDVSAIRNLMRMFYDRSVSAYDKPRYLLLFGDGSYDNKTLSSSNSNYILTYQSENSLSETSSFTTDDFFGLLDYSDQVGSGIMDLGIGRFPVRTTSEANGIINKIIKYKSRETFGEWRNNLTFIADDEDGNLHMGQANDLASYIDTAYPAFYISKIFLDAYKQQSSPSGNTYPEAHDAVSNKMKYGTLIMNYTGHGGELGLTGEKLILVNDIQEWTNISKLPLFVTASCEFSRYDDYERTSAGEYIILNSKGGGIALLSTTRLVYASLNFELNKNFYYCVFEFDTVYNSKYRLGDITKLTKNKTGISVNSHNFALLGDPALTLAYPSPNVVTTKINNIAISTIPDTLKALAKVSISGQIENIWGVKQSNFNGIVYPRVYDKETTVKTLANDGGTPFIYNNRSNILFRGKASVINGDFSYSFIVPKDILYNYGIGKISYYATDNLTDYQGSFLKFIIGGSENTEITDHTGPEIDLFLNDKTFSSGGITDENPNMISQLFDSSGINTIGNGIGHDLTAVIDNKQESKIILNEYYESDLDSYQSGKLEYLLNSLELGPHTLTLKAWDVYNNSNEVTIDFIVTKAEEFQISHVFNYPNPFTTHTEFMFEHNQPFTDLDVIIQIYTISGKLVKTLQTKMNTTGYRVRGINWDGLDDFGDRIGKGVYIYKLMVRSSISGKIVNKIEKLVILR